MWKVLYFDFLGVDGVFVLMVNLVVVFVNGDILMDISIVNVLLYGYRYDFVNICLFLLFILLVFFLMIFLK